MFGGRQGALVDGAGDVLRDASPFVALDVSELRQRDTTSSVVAALRADERAFAANDALVARFGRRRLASRVVR